MARRATAVQSEREVDPDLLLLSAGDFFGRTGILEKYQSDFLVRRMMQLGYDAVAVGSRELGYDLRAIREHAEAGFPVICANLSYGGERPFPSSVVKSVRGRKVGVFALIGEVARLPEHAAVTDPAAAGEQEIRRLTAEGCDLIILLANMSKEHLVELLPRFAGADLVIRGHAARGEQIADDCADTLGGDFDDRGIPVYYAGDRGRALGRLRIAGDGPEGCVLITSSILYLDRSFDEDPAVAASLAEFQREQGIRRRELQLSEFLARDRITGKIRERYLGVDICRRCHGHMMPAFVLSRHFRAFETLRIRGEEANARCLPCHTTGYGRFSGYDIERQGQGGVNLQGVQCEACHGPGTEHVRDGTYAAAGARSCRACHTSHWSPDFTFEGYWARSRHCGVQHAGSEDDAR